jgi:hypothetical protein
MFDPAANNPQHTAWTMQLLQLLDKAVGPGVMEKPVFPNDEWPGPPLKDPDSPVRQDVSVRAFELLAGLGDDFEPRGGGQDKPRKATKALRSFAAKFRTHAFSDGADFSSHVSRANRR